MIKPKVIIFDVDGVLQQVVLFIMKKVNALKYLVQMIMMG